MQLQGEEKAYDLVANGEVSSILSNFSTDFIFDTTDEMMRQRFDSFSLIPKNNFVYDLELAFKDMLIRYPGDSVNIKQVRQETYLEILERISSNSGITFAVDEDVDLYYLAYSIFDLFIANCNVHVFNFVCNFITSQKDYLFNTLNLRKSIKSKDVSTVYNKELFNDQKLAVINANLDTCIEYMTGIDFTSKDTLEYIFFGTEDVSKIPFLLEHIPTEADLFETLILPVLKNDYLYPSISIMVKLEIQKNNVVFSEKYEGGEHV